VPGREKIQLDSAVAHLQSYLGGGTIGRDVLNQCSRMTLNFESMSFVLE